MREVLRVKSDERAELEELGWNERFASAFEDLDEEGVQPGRLAADFGTKFLVQLAGSGPLATLGSALRDARLVAAGDWVAVRQTPGTTESRALLPREAPISHLRGMGGLVTAAYQGGAARVIVLTKVVLNNPAPFEAELETMAAGVPVVAVSSRTGAGIEAVRLYLSRGKTAVLVGSS